MANGVSVTSRWPFLGEVGYGPYAENTWHASYNPLLSTADDCATAMKNGIVAFWAQSVTHLTSMSRWLAPCMGPTVSFSYVDWEDEDNVSVPMPDEGFTVGTADGLPNEVGLVLSFKCDPYGGHRRQSFYNRVYLGPFITTANTSLTSTGPGRPSGNLRDDILAGYTNLVEAMDIFGADAGRHCVYSPTHDSSGLVASAWVDDAWDTQRRRGVEPTEKNFWEP